MISPKDLSVKHLKGMHKMTIEKWRCALEEDWTNRAECTIILEMLDTELTNRGYDVTKLFKGYDPNEWKDKSE